ncbi:MAG TPA: apolipoprotein N-acyltransferase [Actinomycetes bacterium]|nr:apolipoprotein N-acyltransferase [Actinomycetes bacterium]
MSRLRVEGGLGAAPGWRRTDLGVLAALASGAALAAAFPAPDIGTLALVALVPLLLVVETTRPAKAAALGYLAGLTFFGLHLLWIAQFLSWTGAVAWLAWGALSAIQAAFIAAFFALVPATRRLGAWRLLVLPACWAVLELVRAQHPIGGFPWGLLAISQHDAGPLLPLARVVGGFGLAAVIVAVNLAVAFWLRALPARPALAGDGGPREGSGGPRSGAWARWAALVGLPVLAAGLLGARLAVPAAPAPSGPPMDVVVVQGGLRGGHGLAQGQTTERVFANHVRLTETVALTPGDPPDLVVWGEGAADADPLANPDRLASVGRAAAAARAPILLGATTRVDDTHRATEGLLFTPAGQLADRYQKRRLVPFGEFVPFGGLLGRLIPATREGVPYDKVPGRRLEPLLIDGVPVGTLMCWESAYPGDARQLTRDGARVLLIMTNNASFGTGAGPRQHLAAGQLRAVEEGRTIVQAAVTGISAVIEPTGAIRQETGLYQETVLRAGVSPRDGRTLYVRYGRGIEAGLVGVAVGGMALAGLRRRPGGAGRPGPSASFREHGPVDRRPRHAPNAQPVPDREDMVPPVGGSS